MPGDIGKVVGAAQTGFVTQDAELAATRLRQLSTVVTRKAAGSGNIDSVAWLDRKYRLVFVRCHFSGGTGTAALKLSIDSASGAAYDALLFTIVQAGTNKDVHLRISDADSDEPSPWCFQAGDQLRVQWANPDSGNMAWGLEIGLCLAS